MRKATKKKVKEMSGKDRFPTISHTFKLHSSDRFDDIFSYGVVVSGDLPYSMDAHAATDMVLKKLDIELLSEEKEVVKSVHALTWNEGEWLALPSNARFVRFIAKNLVEAPAGLEYYVDFYLFTEERETLLAAR